MLPFENRSREADDAFFVDGIHDDILTQLSKVSALRVISRTSVEQFRDTKLPMKAIADQLGVTKILEGGVQRAGDRVRINVQLIDATTDAHLWAESYDRELTAANIFAIQSEVAAAIAGALKAALTPGEQARAKWCRRRTWRRGRPISSASSAWPSARAGRSPKPRSSFDKAIDLDPEFALAYVGLADTLRLQTEYSGRPIGGHSSRRPTQLVSKALELDANLAEAWASKGGIAMEPAARRAGRETAPPSDRAQPELCDSAPLAERACLEGNGSLEEALEHAERAAQLDPLSAIMQVQSRRLDGTSRVATMRRRRAIDGRSRSIRHRPCAMQSLAIPECLRTESVRRRGACYRIEPWPSTAAIQNLPACSRSCGSIWAMQARATRLMRTSYDSGRTTGTRTLFRSDRWLRSGDDATAETHASKALALYPRGHHLIVAVLRNADLRRGDLAGRASAIRRRRTRNCSMRRIRRVSRANLQRRDRSGTRVAEDG